MPKDKIKIIKSKSISDAFEQTIDFINSWDTENGSHCWFRGINNNKLSLSPGAYWRDAYDEITNITIFTQEAASHVTINESSSWETYNLAQHHGIPTRLLDWSESFSAALFFALDMWEGKTTPCIWICKPALLNNTFLGWNGILAPEGKEHLKLWLPHKIHMSHTSAIKDYDGYTYDNEWPLAIYPKKSNKRLTAQQGTFTVHGRQNKPLDQLYALKGGVCSQAFARIDLIIKDKNQALEQLKLLGVRRAAIYPDVDNLVKQIKEDNGW